jgi:hypothetical protein
MHTTNQLHYTVATKNTARPGTDIIPSATTNRPRTPSNYDQETATTTNHPPQPTSRLQQQTATSNQPPPQLAATTNKPPPELAAIPNQPPPDANRYHHHQATMPTFLIPSLFT